MSERRRIGYFGLGLAVITAVLPLSARAQDKYPSRPIHLIVPYPPGGGTDISARVLAQRLGESLGQPVIVENRPGAGTLIGSAYVAKAVPDGYTLLYGSVTHTIASAVYQGRVTPDPVTAYTPISEVACFPFVIVVQPSLGVRSIAELVALAKQKPGVLNYASVGVGTGTNLSGEMFKLQTGTNIVHVPYSGSGPALTALLGGQVQVGFFDPPPVVSYVKTGGLLALAVTTAQRSSAFPGVPTLQEAGLPGSEFTSWWGIFGPAKLPPAVTTELNTAIVTALALPDVKERLAAFAADPVGSTPGDFATLVKQQAAGFKALAKTANIRIE